jgi:hypothetical protein
MLTVALRRLAAIGAVGCIAGFCILAVATSGSAQTTGFDCRASLARVDLGNATVVEPVVANKPDFPCVQDTQGVQSLQIPSGTTGIVTIGPAQAITATSATESTILGPLPSGVAAVTAIDGVTIPSAQITVVGPIQDEAGYVCSATGLPVPFASSTLNVIKIGTQTISLSAPGVPSTIPLGPLGYVKVNEQITTATSITERILDVHLNGIGDVIVGEAAASISGNPCTTTSTTGTSGPTGPTSTTGTTGPVTTGVPPGLNPCPVGSVLDPKTDDCVIFFAGKIIIISRPFAGPIGGTVIPLAVARQKYHSACLYGPGPNYVIVGTNGPDNIIATHKSERILGLAGNDRIAGQGGNDCIDGGPGNDILFGGNGHERMYGGPGNDRISVQGGNSHVYGGTGNNRIFLGNGSDVVYGGPGNNRIAVGRGNSKVYAGNGNNTMSTGDGNTLLKVGNGNNTLYAGNGRARLFVGRGRNRVYSKAVVTDAHCGGPNTTVYLPKIDFPFAKAHGCLHLVPVRLRR